MAFQDFRDSFKEDPRDERGISEWEPRNLRKTTKEIMNVISPRVCVEGIWAIIYTIKCEKCHILSDLKQKDGNSSYKKQF